MLRAFADFWKGSFDFRGRTGKKAFWLTLLDAFLALFAVTALTMLLSPAARTADSPPAPLLLFLLVMAVPTAALIVRRLRDVGYGWGWVFLFFLAVPGWIALAALVSLTDRLLGVTAPGLSTLVKIIVDTVLFLASYLIQKKWVFKKHEEKNT